MEVSPPRAPAPEASLVPSGEKANAVISQPLEEHDGVEIVAYRVSSDQQPGLDTCHLGECRNAQAGNLFGLQRTRSAELANPGQNAIELTEDQHRPLYPLGLPAGGRLERCEHVVETVPEIFEDVISVYTDAVSRMNRGCGAADHDRTGDEVLEVAFRRQQPFPLRKAFLLRAHHDILTRFSGRGHFPLGSCGLDEARAGPPHFARDT